MACQLDRRIPVLRLPRVPLPLGRRIPALLGEVRRFPSQLTHQRPPVGGPIAQICADSAGKDEFPRLATSEASRKAAAAAKKKAEELKKPMGSEKKDVSALPTVEEKDDDMDVDAEKAYWRGTPVEPAAPATAPTPKKW